MFDLNKKKLWWYSNLWIESDHPISHSHSQSAKYCRQLARHYHRVQYTCTLQCECTRPVLDFPFWCRWKMSRLDLHLAKCAWYGCGWFRYCTLLPFFEWCFLYKHFKFITCKRFKTILIAFRIWWITTHQFKRKFIAWLLSCTIFTICTIRVVLLDTSLVANFACQLTRARKIPPISRLQSDTWPIGKRVEEVIIADNCSARLNKGPVAFIHFAIGCALGVVEEIGKLHIAKSIGSRGCHSSTWRSSEHFEL